MYFYLYNKKKLLNGIPAADVLVWNYICVITEVIDLWIKEDDQKFKKSGYVLFMEREAQQEAVWQFLGAERLMVSG